jgi:hypothetical protein
MSSEEQTNGDILLGRVESGEMTGTGMSFLCMCFCLESRGKVEALTYCRNGTMQAGKLFIDSLQSGSSSKGHLPSKCEALSSSPSTRKKKKMSIEIPTDRLGV